VDASRLRILAPYAAHRRKDRYPDARYDSPNSFGRVQEESILRATIAATPCNKDIFAANAPPRLPVKAGYLIRDTMKAMGYSENDPAPTVASFMFDMADIEVGGTGHTIRVCRQVGGPVLLQSVSDALLKKDRISSVNAAAAEQYKRESEGKWQ
jgi:hypothetical protein